MARKSAGSRLGVFINAHLVGYLRKESSAAIAFQYDSTWMDWEHAFPVSLSLPLREARYVGEPVVAVLDNLLPDDRDVRMRLAARVHSPGIDAYSLLAAIGRDCIGALQFLPDGTEPGPAGQVTGEPAAPERIATLLAELDQTPLGVSAEDAEFRISLAGAQEKTALLFWKSKWHVPHGSTATTHIFKPPIGVLRNGLDLSHSVENEYFCMQLTAALGMPCAKTQIVTFGNMRALVVERFDRRWTKDKRLLRLPQEDCCQALSIPPARKYQVDGGPAMSDVLQLLKASDQPDVDRRAFMKAQMVFWLLGATDGHAKNFSLFLLPGGGFRLTPLYDVMSLQPSYEAHQVKRNRMKLAMSVGNKKHYVLDTVLPRHFVQSAANAGMPTSVAEELLQELATASPAAISTVLEQLPAGFPEHISKSIVGGYRRRLRLIEHA